MELEELKELMGLLKDSDVTELQIEKDGVKVKIKREKFYGHLEMPPTVFTDRREIKAAEPDGEADLEGRLFTVTSPIVGTFYRTASPDTDVFVEIGSRVKKGQVLCIIEAMKLMNEIESEIEGVVVRILVENGNPVEYGEPLFLIEPV